MDPNSAESTPALTTDAAVGVAASLVYVTTGPKACEVLGETPTQVAMTSVIAGRIAEILKVSLQYPDLETRQSLVEAWMAGERAQVPYACVELDMGCVRIGIEPLGAGARVAILWEHVPALILCLEHYARAIRSRAG
ncbi:MAG: hypothetical protein AAGB93_10115 [Planctomycetota bacterium]